MVHQVFSIYQIEKETYYTTNSFESEKAFEEFCREKDITYGENN